MRSKRIGVLLCLLVATFASAPAGAGTSRVARNPYVGAIVIEAESGAVLLEDGADRKGYPASVVKLMDLLVVLEAIDSGHLQLEERVTVTREAARMGGSQVYLAENEVFTLEDLLYALMVQSANDAAVALAVHIAGSKEAFVELMNERARKLGMTSTRFQSPHGLPPARGQLPDVTTARDIALLARELLRRSDVVKYTSTRERSFRDGKFTLRSHNKLLDSFAGCDGLKTGYTYSAGFSVAATALRDRTRLIAVVLGSESSRTRDRKAVELLAKGFETVPSLITAAERDTTGPFLDVQ